MTLTTPAARVLQRRAGFASGSGSRATRLPEANERNREKRMPKPNERNREKRMPKAYVDEDGDVVLEQYVLPTGATDPAAVASVITGPWIASVIQYGATHH